MMTASVFYWLWLFVCIKSVIIQLRKTEQFAATVHNQTVFIRLRDYILQKCPYYNHYHSSNNTPPKLKRHTYTDRCRMIIIQKDRQTDGKTYTWTDLHIGRYRWIEKQVSKLIQTDNRSTNKVNEGYISLIATKAFFPPTSVSPLYQWHQQPHHQQ